MSARFSEQYAAVADSLPTDVVSAERRRSAVEMLTAQGLPTSRDENWKYVNLRPLEKVRFTPAPPSPIDASALPPAIQGYERRVFVNGAGGAAPTQLSSPVGPDARFAALNDVFATGQASIHVTSGAACLELVFVATADAQAGASYPRVNIHVEPNARLTLIERHLSVGSDSNFVNSFVNVQVDKGATVQHYRVQSLGARAIWYDTLNATLTSDATYRVYSVGLGAQIARSTVSVKLAGERAETGIYAASVGDRQQNHDTYVVVDHTVPRARTEQTFRGIAGGRSRVSFNGKVVVRKDAHGTDSQQSLRGLLAGPEAEIDVRPQLEIYTDDVRCAHGATAGKLDENMKFYLLSRGLEPETVQRLLEWAFLEDVVARIEVPELRKQIEQSLDQELS
ncbi:MAG TPA: Fe-S cluster assembly protein SufD [Steroidobacteraceae bacterium]|jgi:Fe-S cluster assembly protein SufD